MPHGRDDLGTPGAATPTRIDTTRGGAHKRKQTLLSLLEALSELSKDEDVINTGNLQPSFEDDRDVPTVDEHLQVVGAEAFHKFQRRITNLDKELRNFSNAARQLGSSVGILSSAYNLRERLVHILHLFRENAADLFPRKIHHQPRDHHATSNIQRVRRRKKAPPNVARPQVSDELDPEEFPMQLQDLAKDVMTLLNCLNEFPEFTDEAVNASIQSFEGDLKYWASCLKAYDGQFKYPAVQRYLHDLTSEMGEHLDSITSTLSYFTEVGVPTIRFAQKHGAANLQNLSTVATFFSAVTATTLQFSFNMTGSPLSDAVNAFWFSSLVFSIASAVNSLLGLTWKQAMYRSPGHRVPWWVLIWIKRSPLVFLVVSVASFSIGLVLFAYSSNQSHVTSTITTVFTSFSSFGLIAVSAWFASERWAFARHEGQKWLADVLDDAMHHFHNLQPVLWCTRVSRNVARRSRKSLRLRRPNPAGTLGRVSTWTQAMWRRASSPENSDNDTLPYSQSQDPTSPRLSDSATAFSTGKSGGVSAPGSPIVEKAGGSAPGDGSVDPNDPYTQRPARERLATAVRSMMLMRRASPFALSMSPSSPRAPHRQRTSSSSMMSPDGSRGRDLGPLGALKGSRLAALSPKLKSLETTQDLAAHQALVRHLQFSPNGKFLATSSWDRTSVIFRVGDPFTQYRVLAQPSGFVGQVAWSPLGNILLTKMSRGVKVWTQDGVCKKTIDRKHPVQSITWLSEGEAFLSVEGCDVVKLDLKGNVLDIYHFDRLTLHDVAVSPDGQRLFGVGTLKESEDGLQPSKSRAEKRIIAFNVRTKEMENQVPVLNDVRDITMARSGKFALVSYENKAPPQLWNLDMLKGRNESNPDLPIVTARLTLRHTYMPKVQVDFAGPSYFGGKDDQLVLCAGKAGDIHIWDRESGALLHHVRAQVVGGDLTCIAWNGALEDPFMFATGSHDGAVRIWTTPSQQSQSQSQPFVLDVRGPEQSPQHSPSRTPSHSPRALSPVPPSPRPESLVARTVTPDTHPPPLNLTLNSSSNRDPAEYPVRTESPVPQDGYDSHDGQTTSGYTSDHDPDHDDYAPLRNTKTVAFSTPPKRSP